MQQAIQAGMLGPPVIGEIIFEGSDLYYSPWFPRGADVGKFSIEVIAISGVTLSWDVETKNSEDVDSAAVQVGSTQTETTAGVSTTSKFTGFKELVRYRYKTGVTASMDWVHFRMLNPAWLYN